MPPVGPKPPSDSAVASGDFHRLEPRRPGFRPLTQSYFSNPVLTHRIYYTLKPYLPWRLRIAMRRVLARRLREANRSTWPIDPASATPPAGWQGWPDGKKFALVLTHDVESAPGLEKVRRLAELEQQLGFRSTFNLIPEGPYTVPAELRNWLQEREFEVGVHDLRHDGWLFASQPEFERQAQRINHHLRTWQARGFRSGFMLRNLDWLHQLDVAYDASTFDTDPFEMQSDGAGTIFPFWIHPDRPAEDFASSTAGHRGGYMELPYTLPQDSTLFLLLQEKTPEIWLRKLDWIAEQGGMALVNVHPDYLRFDGEPPGARTFPVEHYTTLLEHVRSRYGDTCWHALAGDVASYAKATKPLAPAGRPV